VIDACVFHEWDTVESLGPYLAEGWRELLLEPRTVVSRKRLYPNLLAERMPVITDVGQLVSRLDSGDCERVVLSSDGSLLATANVNHFAALAVGNAMNRWTEEEWLTADDRVYGLIVAVCSLPEEAAAEIRRSGNNPRMVGVLLGSAGLGSPLGHPAYQPIFQAASDLDLPIVLQAGVDATEYAVPTPIAGGLPATSAEYRAFSWHSQATHVSSLIMQGVFDQYPRLKVLLVGAGAIWFPGHLWRMDHRFMATRGDGRWLIERPGDYGDRFFFSTYQLERPPRPEQRERALSVIPGADGRLIYASGFPDADSEEPDRALEGIPSGWKQAVLRENALGFFRWPDRATVDATEPRLAKARGEV
jgi:uncharacterized protein